MKRLPDVLFVSDVGYESIALQEAKVLGIPVVGIVDTNNSPDGVDYIIPSNDDSVRSLQLVINAVSDGIKAAKVAAGEVAAEEVAAPAQEKPAEAEAAPVEAAPEAVAEAPVAEEATTAEAKAE